ncbi:hypothetical protein ACRAWD_20385 [Caulobacter segnis]
MLVKHADKIGDRPDGGRRPSHRRQGQALRLSQHGERLIRWPATPACWTPSYAPGACGWSACPLQEQRLRRQRHRQAGMGRPQPRRARRCWEEMNRLGVIPDPSHSSDAGRWPR